MAFCMISFFFSLPRSKYTQSVGAPHVATENIKRSRRISLRTRARSCAKHLCFVSCVTPGFGPYSGLGVSNKGLDRIPGYPLAAFSFAMPYPAGWIGSCLIYFGGKKFFRCSGHCDPRFFVMIAFFFDESLTVLLCEFLSVWRVTDLGFC